MCVEIFACAGNTHTPAMVGYLELRTSQTTQCLTWERFGRNLEANVTIYGENAAGKGFSHAVSLFASSERHRSWCYVLKSYVYSMMLSQQTWKQGNSTRKPFVLSLIAEEIYRLISRGVWKWRWTVQAALLKGIKGKDFFKRKRQRNFSTLCYSVL